MRNADAIGAYVYDRLTEEDRTNVYFRLEDMLEVGDSDGLYCAVNNMGVSIILSRDEDYNEYVAENDVKRFCCDIVQALDFPICEPEDWERIVWQAFGLGQYSRIMELYEEAEAACSPPAAATEAVEADANQLALFD